MSTLSSCVNPLPPLSHTINPRYVSLSDCQRVLTHPRLTPAMAMKYGFQSVEEYKAKAQEKFSLLKTGIIKGPSTRLLLVNVGFPLSLKKRLLAKLTLGRASRTASCLSKTQ